MLGAISAFYRPARELALQLGTVDRDLRFVPAAASVPGDAVGDLKTHAAAKSHLLQQSGSPTPRSIGGQLP
eukprot:5495722-Pyramimonas_sp.AAC.1